jgi:uncharacterized cupredoxin-like copper-binding protein
MHRRLLPAFAIFLAAPTLAQGPPATVTVRLASYHFTPDVVRLKAGQPVRLRLVNASAAAHDFQAPKFFAKAGLGREERRRTRDGRITVPSGQIREIELAPAAGRYDLRCGQRLHAVAGERGRIVVE